ncbi:hypothetical protein PSm6_18750 [Pseudomonas solani]|uniref:Dioxygenase n=1 Tax=Pseudomonas solani TaxID=2731552 RepID=A0ABM7L786_9PSED|nr:hypothetical protein [Pseudomonas solani]BCD85468.1 hypothetical protein PSm6_18750 [Pseudomonas solani]
MVVNIVGNAVLRSVPEGLSINTEESGAFVSATEAKLIPPAATYLRFSTSTVEVLNSYKEDGCTVIASGNEWHTRDLFIGGDETYCVLRSVDAEGNKFYGVYDWSGSELGRLPFIVGDKYFASTWVALSQEKTSQFFTLQGEKLGHLQAITVSVGRQQPIFFTECFALFKHAPGSDYQIYDVSKQQLTSTIRVSEAVCGVVQSASGLTYLVDAQGIKQLDYDGESATLEPRHIFDTPLDIDQAKVRLWCDEQHLYVAVNRDGESQVLISVELKDIPEVQVLSWSAPWVINFHGGFVGGYNYVTLRRDVLLSDNAVLLWKTGQPLSPELLDFDLSPVVEVSQAASSVKGKHGYRLRIEDTSCNRAIRSAAYELGRVIGESCSGAYNQSEAILDRKFDGQFHIEVTTSIAPNEFEQAFLPAYIQYFRKFGGLSPAGSKASLADPIITWNTPAS